MKNGILLVAALLPVFLCHAQDNRVRLQGNPIDPNRYERTKNSPYLFDEWVTGSIIPSSGPPVENVLLNFNGYTQNFEVHNGELIIEVELGYFVGIRLDEADDHCGRQSFLKYYHPRLVNKYPLFVFNGQKHRLIKDFRVRLNENKVESPGRTEVFKSFAPVLEYYLMTGSDIEPVRLQRKEILKLFPSKETEMFVDREHIDLETEQGLCQLLSWIEKH